MMRQANNTNAASLGHRIWIVVALSFGAAASNGFARFAYALVLPAMRADLGWTYAQAGWLNTANALGYLVGELLTLRLVSAGGNTMLFSVGMVVTGVALIGSGLTQDFAALLVWRALAGVSGAPALMCGAVLAGNVFPERTHWSSTAIAVYFGGVGAGILLSGAGIPWLLAVFGNDAWSRAWLAMGIVSVAMAVFSIQAALSVPESSQDTSPGSWSRQPFRAMSAGYFLSAVGYIAYMTFVIAWMKSHGAGAAEISAVWGLLGLAVVLAPFLWRVPLAHWKGGRPLAASIAVLAVGAAIPLVETSAPAMLLSALLFGDAVLIPPAAITALHQEVATQTRLGKRRGELHRGVRDRSVHRAGNYRMARGCDRISARGTRGLGRGAAAGRDRLAGATRTCRWMNPHSRLGATTCRMKPLTFKVGEIPDASTR